MKISPYHDSVWLPVGIKCLSPAGSVITPISVRPPVSWSAVTTINVSRFYRQILLQHLLLFSRSLLPEQYNQNLLHVLPNRFIDPSTIMKKTIFVSAQCLYRFPCHSANVPFFLHLPLAYGSFPAVLQFF